MITIPNSRILVIGSRLRKTTYVDLECEYTTDQIISCSIILQNIDKKTEESCESYRIEFPEAFGQKILDNQKIQMDFESMRNIFQGEGKMIDFIWGELNLIAEIIVARICKITLTPLAPLQLGEEPEEKSHITCEMVIKGVTLRERLDDCPVSVFFDLRALKF